MLQGGTSNWRMLTRSRDVAIARKSTRFGSPISLTGPGNTAYCNALSAGEFGYRDEDRRVVAVVVDMPNPVRAHPIVSTISSIAVELNVFSCSGGAREFAPTSRVLPRGPPAFWVRRRSAARYDPDKYRPGFLLAAHSSSRLAIAESVVLCTHFATVSGHPTVSDRVATSLL